MQSAISIVLVSLAIVISGCAGKRTQSEGLAFELRLPHIRLVDGMGGGGSVKTIEMAGRTYIPELRGWETVIRHLGVAPSVSCSITVMRMTERRAKRSFCNRWQKPNTHRPSKLSKAIFLQAGQ